MEPEEVAHLAGVFDAIGTITVHITEDKSYGVGYRFVPILQMVRPENKEDPLLGKIIEYCEENNAHYQFSDVSYNNNHEKKSHKWTCRGTHNIRNFLEPILPYLVSKYEQAMMMLEEILPRVEEDMHREKDGFYELMYFVDSIRGTSKSGKKIKYDRDYFTEKWSVA